MIPLKLLCVYSIGVDLELPTKKRGEARELRPQQGGIVYRSGDASWRNWVQGLIRRGQWGEPW